MNALLVDLFAEVIVDGIFKVRNNTNCFLATIKTFFYIVWNKALFAKII